MSVGIDAKVALILGGAGGIGSAAARDLAARGARVTGAALRKSSDPALVVLARGHSRRKRKLPRSVKCRSSNA